MYNIYNVIFGEIYSIGQGQVIAIVDAFDDPTIESDLGVFDTEFNLAPCTTANGCFSKIYSNGKQPAQNASWSTEIALDVEWAHAMAPGAGILLVEAPSASSSDLMAAVQVAVVHGATEVSMSWGVPEYVGELVADAVFQAGLQSRGVAFFASAGDGGHGVEYPSTSPFVVGVGGTTVTYDQYGNWVSEAVWNNSLGSTGGGLSRFEAEPEWQGPVQTLGNRSVPDLAYDADPSTGVAVYSSQLDSGQKGWMQLGGTSIGAPQVAAITALVNNVRLECNGSGPLTLPDALYTNYGMYHDITMGSNGHCGMLCNAAPGFDFTTGFGSPIGWNMANDLAFQCYE
jgi:subtilase family serine protease